jgi:hypothetical protein
MEITVIIAQFLIGFLSYLLISPYLKPGGFKRFVIVSVLTLIYGLIIGGVK